MSRIIWSDELQTLIDAQRAQDDAYRAQEDARDALRDATHESDETVRLAYEAVIDAENVYDGAVIARVETERSYRQWWDRERASGVPHSIQRVG